MIFIENHENHTIVIFQWTNHTSKLLHWSKLTTIYSYYATLCKLLKSYIQRSKYYWDHVHENMTVIMACIAAAFFCGNAAWGHRTCGIGLFHSTFGNDGWRALPEQQDVLRIKHDNPVPVRDGNCSVLNQFLIRRTFQNVHVAKFQQIITSVGFHVIQ